MVDGKWLKLDATPKIFSESLDSLLWRLPPNVDTYHFPAEIADEVGFSPNYINNLKRLGCHFHGRKTTIRHVRDFLAKMAEEVV